MEDKNQYEVSSALNEKSAKLLHLKIEGEINYNAKTFSAEATLEFRFAETAETLKMEGIDFVLDYVRIEESDVEFTYDKKVISVSVPKPFRGGSASVRVRYSVVDPSLGLYFITKDKYGQHVENQVWTIGEGHTNDFMVVEDNRCWFPYVSGPSTKCTSETIITVPKPQEVISNGTLVEVKDLGKKRSFHWKMDKLHSMYLVSIVAGEFEREEEMYDKVKLQYVVPKGRKGDIRRSFESTKELFKFYESYTGVKYPHDKFSQTCVFEASFGGMENTTANTMTVRTLHDKIAHIDFSSEENVGHHLAHQWYGDIVTCRTWEDVWLNEGLAAFVYPLYLRKRYGEDEFYYHVLDKLDLYLSVERKRGVSEVCTTYGPDPKRSFDRFNSEKGGLVMLSLLNMIGSDTMHKAMLQYFSKFSYGTASTKDLENLLIETSGRDLHTFFNQYVYSRGYPIVSSAYSYDKDAKKIHLSLSQLQDLKREFQIDVNVFLNYEDGSSVRVPVSFNERSYEIDIPSEKRPNFVCVDPELAIVGEHLHSEELEQTLVKIKLDKHLACRIRSIRTLSHNSGLKALECLSFILEDEKIHSAIRVAAAETLGSINTTGAHNILMKNVSNPEAKVRRAVIKALGEFKTEGTFKALVSALEKEKSYYVRSEIMHSLGKAGHKDAMDILEKGLSEESHNDVVPLGSIRGISAMGNDESLRSLINVIKSTYKKPLKIASINELKCFTEKKDARDVLLELIDNPEQEVRETSLSIALKSGVPELADLAQQRFLRRYYIESQRVMLV